MSVCSLHQPLYINFTLGLAVILRFWLYVNIMNMPSTLDTLAQTGCLDTINAEITKYHYFNYRDLYYINVYN